jgi:hypothetical protein
MLGACTTTPEFKYQVPPISVVTGQGTVKAFDVETAQRVARLLEELNPEIQGILGTSSSSELHVLLLDCNLPDNAAGSNYEGSILMGREMRKTERFVLAHELVHWNATGIWKRLTPAEAEGLADVIAIDLSPKAQDSAMVKLDHMYTLRSGLVRDPREALDSEYLLPGRLGPDQTASSRAIGYFAVARVGVSGLRSLCTDAKLQDRRFVSASSLLEKAGLPIDDVMSWDVEVTIPIEPGTTSITLRALWQGSP